MGKLFKRTLATIMAILIVLTCVPLSGFVGMDWSGFDFSVKVSALSSSGSCGENVTYSYNNATKELVISGRGAMTNYSSGGSPFYGCDIRSIVIKSGVTTIGNLAFSYCDSLQSIKIPDSVTGIGESAFYKCTSLQSVTIPDSVTSIGGSAFYYCTSLLSVTIPDSVTTIGYWAFTYCTSLQSVKIGNSVTSIGGTAFSYCDSLQSVTIGDRVTSIGDDAFYKCTSLQSVTIPDSVTTIGDDAFSYCDSLQSVTIGNSVTTIGDGAFSYCRNLQSVTIPDSVTTIFGSAFCNCTSLQSVKIGNGVGSIGSFAFYNCTSLHSVKIGRVVYINDDAFARCTSLQSITIPDNVERICDDAFEYCKNLKDVYYSGTEEQWLKIFIMDDNYYLTGATIHYNYIPVSKYYPEPTASYNLNNLKSGDIIHLSAFKETYGEKERLLGVSWYSTNSTVATVSSAGVVTIKNKGVAQIYFKYADIQSSYLPIISNGYIVTEDFNIMNTKPDAMPSIDIAGQQILDKTGFDIKEILSNISLEGGKLKGPTVNIMGQEVTLFEFDVGAEFPLLDETTIIVDRKEKKIKVGIGIKEDNSAQVGKAGQKTTYWSESYREVKKLYQNATGKKVTTTKLWNDFSALRGRLKKINGKMALNCDTYLAGYLEFSYSGSSYKFLEGGVLAECNFGASVESRWASFPAAYTVFGVKAGAHGDLTVKVEDYKSSYTGNIGGDLEASFGVGLGEKNVTDTYIEGGMEATLGVNFAFPATTLKDSMTINMTGDLYITAHAVGYELYSDKFIFTNVQLYPTFKENKRRMMLRSVSTDEVESTATPIDRDYTTDDSKIDLIEDTFKKSDIYGFNSPTLVKFGDDKQMLVWVDDDGTKLDINRTTLYYSVFNGSVWSMPSIVCESKGYNGTPVVVSDGANVHILWGMSPEMSETDGYTDLIESMELNYIKYNGTAFEAPVKITNNSTLEFSYDMYVSNSNVTFTWIENTDNNSFMGTGENILKTSTILNGEVAESEVIYETSDIINGSTFVNSKYYVITENDNGSCLYEIVDGNCTELRSIAERMSQLDNFDGLVTFVEDSRLIKYNGEAFYAFTLENVDNYSYVTNGSDKAILTLAYGENGTVKMMASYYNEEDKTWSSFVPVLDEGTYIRNYSPIMDNDGKILAAVNAVELNENPAIDGLYGEATLFVLNGSNYFDLAISDYLSKGKSDGEDEEKLFFEVTNYSSVTVDSLTVYITDTNGGNNSADINCELLPGETKEFSVAYDGLSALGKKEITVTISNKSYVENNKNNNSVTTTIGYADIAVENVVATYDECKGVLKFDVKNIGFENADNIVVSVVANNGSDVVLKRETIQKLAPDESNEYICVIPADLLSNDNEEVFNSLAVSVTTDVVEESTVNNTESIGYSNFSELVEDGVERAEHHYESVITAPTCTEDGYTTYTCTVCGDGYIDDNVEALGHKYKNIITKATLTSEGKIEHKCDCGDVEKSEEIAKIDSLTLSKTKYIYDGKNKTPKVTVKDANGKVLTKNVDYKTSVASKRAGVGRYTVKVTFMGNYSGTKSLYFYILPGKPATVKSASQSTSAIKLSWSAVPGAVGYTVYRYSPSKKAYVKAGTTEGTTLTVSKLLTGTKYTFRVVAYGKTASGKVYDSETYALLKSATKTKTPELTKVTASSTKGKAYVYHSNVSGEAGYTVYYSTSKDSGFKKYANFKADTTRCDITKLTSGKTYYFKVRTYIKTDSGYVYSAWSSVKSVKVK